MTTTLFPTMLPSGFLTTTTYAPLAMEETSGVGAVNWVPSGATCNAEFWATRTPLDNWSMCFWAMRRYDEGIKKLQEALGTDPHHYPTHYGFGILLGQKGNFSEAVEKFKQAIQISYSAEIMGALGYVYAASGNPEKAQRVLEEMQSQRTERYVSAYSVALVYAGLAEHDLAFEWLDVACEEKDDLLSWGLGIDPRWDGLRSDQRYVQLMERIGLHDSLD